MQELFVKIVNHIPAFVGDLIELLTAPKRFLVTQARRDTDAVADGLIFLGIAAVISVILASPMIGVANLVQTTILLVIAGVVVFAVSAFLLILAWKLVGGAATPREQVVVFAYMSAPLVLVMPVVLLLGWPTVMAAAPEDRLAVGGEWFASSMTILAVGYQLWTLVVWGAYRTLNNVSKGRSTAAFVLTLLFGIPASLLGTQLGLILGWYQ